MFCNVCRKAGKSDEEIHSHFVRESRDPNSRVTCPTLLAQKCRFCHEPGHTPRGCPQRINDYDPAYMAKKNGPVRDAEYRVKATSPAALTLASFLPPKSPLVLLESDTEDDTISTTTTPEDQEVEEIFSDEQQSEEDEQALDHQHMLEMVDHLQQSLEAFKTTVLNYTQRYGVPPPVMSMNMPHNMRMSPMSPARFMTPMPPLCPSPAPPMMMGMPMMPYYYPHQ
jgi:hypothetical protein